MAFFTKQCLSYRIILCNYVTNSMSINKFIFRCITSRSRIGVGCTVIAFMSNTCFLLYFFFVLLLQLTYSKNVFHLNEYSVWSDPKINHLFFASTRINIDNKINKILLNLIIRKHKYLKVEFVT